MKAREQELIELNRRLFALGLKLNIDALYQEFCEPGGDRVYELSLFVRWLFLKGHLSEALAEELIAELAVEVTGLDVLDSYYDQTRTVDLKHGDPLGIFSSIAPLPARQSGYQLLKQVGAGAMGSVHLAKDRLLRRTVAFKQLLDTESTRTDLGVSRRFLGEAQITSQLDHPHVVPIYGLETQPDGKVAYTMKMIQGQSLKQWLAKARSVYAQKRDAQSAKKHVPAEFRLNSRLRLFLKICDAMAFAHNKGVIHRDLKPANVMLGRYGEVYVMDWGIARPFSFEDQGVEIESMELYAHEKGQIVGTPRYMSPEQAAGMNDDLDQRSDLFALGLILYEMVSFRQAIQAKGMSETLKRVVKGQLEPLKHAYDEKIPAALAAIITKATQRLRKDRYREVSELAADLRRFLNEERVFVHDETAVQRLQRAIHRHRQYVLPGLLGLLLLGGGLTLSVELLRQRQQVQAEAQRQRTGALLADLASHGQQLGGRFQLLENSLLGLVSAAQIALTEGLPSADKVYFNEDFVSGRAPADWLDAPASRRTLSFEAPVFKRAPNSQIARDLPARLMPLRFAFYNLFAQSLGPEGVSLARDQQIERLRNMPGTLLNAYVGLQNGLHLSYPGKGGFKADYDPRTRPWYLLGKQLSDDAQKGPAEQARWGEPFQDALGLGQVLPCVSPIHNRQGELLGVAGIEASLKAVSEQWLPIKDHPEIKAVWLQTIKNQTITSWPLEAFKANLETPAEFQGLSGSGFKLTADQQIFIAWTPLERQNWLLVVKGDLGELYRN